MTTPDFVLNADSRCNKSVNIPIILHMANGASTLKESLDHIESVCAEQVMFVTTEQEFFSLTMPHLAKQSG